MPNREWLYYRSNHFDAGLSGQAFSTFVPHTVRAKETKQCSDCHVSASTITILEAQLFSARPTTNFMNFMGRYIYVATGEHGLEAVAVGPNMTSPMQFTQRSQRIGVSRQLQEIRGASSRTPCFSRAPGNRL